MSDNLSPCPFCGGEAYIAHRKDKYNSWNYYCGCVDCGVETLGHGRMNEAIEAWNKRANPWHTGTPTEEGDYYIAFRNFLGADVEYGWATWDGKGWDINFMGWDFSNKILAWQKIEPFKENETCFAG